MWQRKQTIYLALAAVCAALTFVLPVSIYSVKDRPEEYRYMARAFESRMVLENGTPAAWEEAQATKMPLHILLGVVGVVILVSIFLYGDRKRQIRVLRGTYLMTAITIAGMFITHRSITSYLSGLGEVSAMIGPSAILPLVMLALCYAAERAIKRDEDLVKSADRLR